jgi:pilus assembly protein Flp/PilA
MVRKKRGQGLVEYALILALVAVVVIVVLSVLGPSVQNVYCDVYNGLEQGQDLTCEQIIARARGNGNGNGNGNNGNGNGNGGGTTP